MLRVMQNQERFCLCLTKINTNFVSAVPALLILSLVGPTPSSKNLFMRLST